MIVDSRGNPIQRSTLAEPQTARLGHLHREFENHPSRGLTPQKLATILDEAEQGLLMSQHELFHDMEEKDGHVMAEMAKRKRALLGFEWDICPPPDATAAEKKVAEHVKELLRVLPDVEDVILDMADGIGHGFAAQEIEWQRTERRWLPKQIHFRPQSWFQTTQDRRNELRLRDHTPEGATLNPFGWIVHVHRARSGYLARAGLHRTLAWPYLFKNYAVRDLAELLEIYGLPIRIGTYPPNASAEEKATLLRAVVSLGHNAAGIIPEGMLIEFKEAAKAEKTPFETMIEWCERTQSKVIVGATLTSQTDQGGAYALGQVHHEVMWDLVLSDCRQIKGTISRDLIWPIVALNFAGITDPSRAPRFEFDTQEPEDMKLYADALPRLVEVGVRIPEAWAREKLRIPEGQGEERMLARAIPATPPLTESEADPEAEPLRQRATLRSAPAAPDLASRFAEQLEVASARALAAMLAQIRQMAERAESLEELQTWLAAAYPDLNSGPLAGVLQQAMVAAHLGGRHEGQEGI